MFQFFQLTAEYSNAVLVAVLPFVVDFARKIDIAGSYSTNTLVEFRCDYRTGEVGGLLRFSNRNDFLFQRGHVNSFQSPRAYYDLQDPADIPKFFGVVKMSETEALALARKKLEALGYSLADLYADQPPEVTPPVHTRGGIVPRFRFEWRDPLILGDWNRTVDIEINAEEKKVEKLFLLSRKANREAPTLSVSQPTPTTPLRDSQRPVNTNAVLQEILETLPAYIKRMELPIQPPTPAEVKALSRYDYFWENSVRLTNGWTFLCSPKEVTGFMAPKCYFRREISADASRPARDFIGEWKIAESDARKIAEAAIRKADPTNTKELLKLEPAVAKPKQVGIYVIPRYLFDWLDGKTKSQAQVEVDASNGTVRYLYVLASLSPSPDPLPERKPTVNTPNPFE